MSGNSNLGPGGPPNDYSFAWLLRKLKLACGKTDDGKKTDAGKRLESMVPKELSGIMLNLTAKLPDGPKRAGFLQLDKKVQQVLGNAFRDGIGQLSKDAPDLEAAYSWMVAELNIAAIRGLNEQGLLKEFLTADGATLAWMFCREFEEEFMEGRDRWSRSAMDKRRSYYQGVYRFWSIFNENKVQSHVIAALSKDLPMVSLAYGEYHSTVCIADAYIKDLRSRSDFDSQIALARHRAYKASALSCVGALPDAEELFAQIGKDLDQCEVDIPNYEQDLRQTGSPRKESFGTTIEATRKFVLRERLRSEIRKAWSHLDGCGWPESPASHIDLETVLEMGKDLQKKIKHSKENEPTDYDTLARAAILANPSAESLGLAKDWIGLARIEFRRQTMSNVEGSLFSKDTIDLTESLYFIAMRDLDSARNLCGEIYNAMPLDRRQHTSHALRAIISLSGWEPPKNALETPPG